MATSYTSNKKIGALDSASTPLAASNEIVINQNGDILKTPLSAVEAKVFDAKTATSTPTGTEVVVVRQTDNTLRQVALSDIVPALNINNAKVSASAEIADTKLATINTAGKVTNNAVQATSANTADRIVARDGSGNFAAGTITATLSGNASTATTAATASQTANTLTRGGYLTGNNFNGAAATTWAVDADTANTANKVVARGATGNFAAGTITAALAGNADTATNLSSNRTFALTGDVTGTVSSNLSSGVSIAASIASGVIVDADISAGAAIASSKLAASAQESLVPTGAVMAFAMLSAPSGWLLANGGEYAKTGTYAALFGAIGTTFGETNGTGGVGTSHFRVPDLRGYFVRGFGTNIDLTASGNFAEKQAGAFASHTHTGTTGNDSPDHSHSFNDYYQASSVGYANGLDGSASRLGVHTFSEVGRTTPNGTAGASVRHQHAFTTAATGDTENRPRNIAMLYCIKF